MARVKVGIIATSPTANITVDQHVANGIKPSQYISTTKNIVTAETYAGPNGIAVIDSTKVPNQTDLSRGSLSLSLKGNYNAIRDSEVLVSRKIPQEAIISVIPKR